MARYGPKPRALEDRFWEKVVKSDGCWVWQAATFQGYGVFGRADGQSVRAHRMSWEMHNGPIPDGLNVLHHCDNPPCVRPDHLFLGTTADNQQDMRSKHREAKGGTHGRRKLSQDQADGIRVAYQQGRKLREVAQQYGVSEATVSLIGRGLKWGTTLTDFSPRRYRKRGEAA